WRRGSVRRRARRAPRSLLVPLDPLTRGGLALPARQRRADEEAARRGGLGDQGAVHEPCPLAHAAQPEPLAVAGPGRPGGAGVLHLDDDPVGADREPDVDLGAGCVPQRVAQRLLHDPVDRERGGLGDPRVVEVAVDVQPDGLGTAPRQAAARAVPAALVAAGALTAAPARGRARRRERGRARPAGGGGPRPAAAPRPPPRPAPPPPAPPPLQDWV